MEVYASINSILGLQLEPKELTWIQISLRGVIVFIVTLMMVRLADRRFLAKLSAFDAILVFILASMLARAVNGSASFFPTLGGGFVLVGIHRLLAMISFRWEAFGNLVKGQADILVEDGKANIKKMRANKISEKDLMEEARLNAQVGTMEEIRVATMERNGEVSVIPAD